MSRNANQTMNPVLVTHVPCFFMLLRMPHILKIMLPDAPAQLAQKKDPIHPLTLSPVLSSGPTLTPSRGAICTPFTASVFPASLLAFLSSRLLYKPSTLSLLFLVLSSSCLLPASNLCTRPTSRSLSFLSSLNIS